MGAIGLSELERVLDDDPQAALFDLRDPELYRVAHIPGAVSASPETLVERLAGLDRQKPVYFACQLGEQRSVAAVALAERMGFAHAFFLEGGTKRWQRADMPLEGEWAAHLAGFNGKRAPAATETAPEQDRSREK